MRQLKPDRPMTRITAGLKAGTTRRSEMRRRDPGSARLEAGLIQG